MDPDPDPDDTRPKRIHFQALSLLNAEMKDLRLVVIENLLPTYKDEISFMNLFAKPKP